ncbi:MAG: hypothetical protein WDZ49_12785 [Litorilinea sp.]
MEWAFDDVISVSTVGAFKPDPTVYRRAATLPGLEMGECLIVSYNLFDGVGAVVGERAQMQVDGDWRRTPGKRDRGKGDG